MREELALAVSLAREAGREVMRWFGSELAVEQKEGEGPVTVADRSADELIRTALARRYPEDGLLSEEGPDDPGRLSRPRVWFVDPLDGTRQFVAGIAEFAVMIGLAVRGRAVLGVVHLPPERTTYIGALGVGALRLAPDGTEEPLAVAPFPDAGRPIAVISHGSPRGRNRRAAEALGAARVLRSGSVGRKAMMIADGRADAYFGSRRSRAWDACAPEAIVRLAGGSFLSGRGEPLRYDREDTRNSDGLLVCRPGLEHRIVAALEAVRSGEP